MSVKKSKADRFADRVLYWTTQAPEAIRLQKMNDVTKLNASVMLMENQLAFAMDAGRFITDGAAEILNEADWSGNAPGATQSSGNMGYPGSENIYANDPASVFRAKALAIVSRTAPDAFGHNLVCIQPMKTPYSVAFARRMVYKGTDIEAGFENVPQFQHQTGTIKVAYTVQVAGATAATGYEFNGIDPTTGRKLDVFGADGYSIDLTGIDVATGAVTADGKLPLAIVDTHNKKNPTATITRADIKTAQYLGGQGAPLQHTEGLVMRDDRFSGSDAPGFVNNSDLSSPSRQSFTPSTTGYQTELELKIAQRPIRALGRKIGSSFSLEDAQDISAMFDGLDLHKESLDAISTELALQEDREIVGACRIAAEDTSRNVGGKKLATFDLTTWSPTGTGAMLGRWNGEIYMTIVSMIVSVADQLALTTGHGSGNGCVASADVVSCCRSANHQFVNYKTEVKPNTAVAYVGRINSTIDLYQDRFAPDSSALVFYKGNGFAEGGVIKSPYVTNLVSEATNPGDFAKIVSIMSRYAITHNLLGAGRYYRLLRFKGINGLIPNLASNVLPGTGALSI